MRGRKELKRRKRARKKERKKEGKKERRRRERRKRRRARQYRAPTNLGKDFIEALSGTVGARASDLLKTRL
jgi:F0F1-type ATP synthase assembly protein I